MTAGPIRFDRDLRAFPGIGGIGAPRRPRPGRTTDRGRSPGARSPSE